MIKLIATDMDGTLLNSKNEIQDGFYEVFNKLEEKGIIFAAASGRQYYNLLNILNLYIPYSLDICHNQNFHMTFYLNL